MGWKRKQATLTTALLALAWIGMPQAQEAATRLRWNNGDVLTGTLLESGAGQIRWSSPVFLDDLVVDVSALDSIAFPERDVPATGLFRIGTVSGDVWTGDLIGSDEEAFLFSSRRFGEVRVNRKAIYSLERLAHPNLAFGGSQSVVWGVAPQEGPIRSLTYQVYDGREEWPRWPKDGVPDLSRLSPVDDGSFAAGYLDLGRDFARQSLIGTNPPAGWRRGPGGHLETDRSNATIFRRVELPERFAIELELMATGRPRFVLAFGEDESTAAQAPHSLRLETWWDALVVVSDKAFARVMTINEEQHDVRLRLAFDGRAREIKISDWNGRSLVRWNGVETPTGESGLLIRNQGEDLTVRRLSIYRQSGEGRAQPVDAARARVHLIDGGVLYGRLFVQDGQASVVDQDGNRRPVALEQVDRIVRPEAELAATSRLPELTYADGSILRGVVERVSSDQVVLRTAFSETPVRCALAGASFLRFRPAGGESPPTRRSADELFLASGRLRGRLSFAFRESCVSWVPEGAAGPVRFGAIGGARVALRRKSLTTRSYFDEQKYPFVLHLKSGEVIPCLVLSYNEKTLRLQSPYTETREISSSYVKAIEFEPSASPDRTEKPAGNPEDWFAAIVGPQQPAPDRIEPGNLDRALTIPRFNRDHPPSHVLVARNGDAMRGRLLAIEGQAVQFESGRRRVSVPIDLLSRAVNVSPPEAAVAEAAAGTGGGLQGLIRATLDDGSVLSFQAVESKDGRLLGRSPIYGDTAVPIESISELALGDHAQERGGSVFEEWVARPAREPEFSKTPPPAKPEEPDASSPAAPSPKDDKTSDIGPRANAGPLVQAARLELVPAVPSPGDDPAVDLRDSLAAVPPDQGIRLEVAQPERDALYLGLVRVDPVGRSLRFPIEINQREGLVEYALVAQTGKTHESLFRTAAEPTHIHAGLLLLGGAPAYVSELASDPLAPLPGEPVFVEVAWREGEAEIIKPLESFIAGAAVGGKPRPKPWIYNGSVMTDDGFVAQAEGSIVSLQLDPHALINNPHPGRTNDESYIPDGFFLMGVIGVPTNLQMIIRLPGEHQGPVSHGER